MDFGPDSGSSSASRRRPFDRSQSDRPRSDRPGPDRASPDRLPPQNLEAEKGLLGSILLENTVFDDIGDRLVPEHFYLDSHRRIFAAIKKLHDQGKHAFDAVTVAEQLERDGHLADCGGAPYLVEILEGVPHAAHARYYAEIVRDKAIQRRLISASTEVLRNAYDESVTTEELLNLAEREIFQILEQQEGVEKLHLKEILVEAFARIEHRMSLRGAVSGVSTGFRDLDARTNGLQPAELIILAARPSMGKTAFVLNLAHAIAERSQKGVAVFSLEMSRHELAERFICIRGRLDMQALRKGELAEHEYDLLMRTFSELSELPVFIDDQGGRNMSQINAICRRLKRKNNLGAVIIDYLQLVEPEDKRAPREQQIAGITRRLKFMAKELEVPVVALAQLNRGVELREDKRPKLADLRESGAIEQDADIVMFLHRPEMYDPQDSPGLAEIIVAKHRNGPTGIVKLTFKKQFMEFEDHVAVEEPSGGYFPGS